MLRADIRQFLIVRRSVNEDIMRSRPYVAGRHSLDHVNQRHVHCNRKLPIVMPIGRRRQKKQLSAPELSAAKSVCTRKTGLARLGLFLARAHCAAVSFVDMDQRAYTIHRTECLSRQNPSLIRRKNPAKFENDCNGRRIKSTEPNLMIVVSFSSAKDALSNDVKKYTTFRMQGTENPPFRFFGDTRYKRCTKVPIKTSRWM